jgi:hypothetical protein
MVEDADIRAWDDPYKLALPVTILIPITLTSE